MGCIGTLPLTPADPWQWLVSAGLTHTNHHSYQPPTIGPVLTPLNSAQHPALLPCYAFTSRTLPSPPLSFLSGRVVINLPLIHLSQSPSLPRRTLQHNLFHQICSYGVCDMKSLVRRNFPWLLLKWKITNQTIGRTVEPNYHSSARSNNIWPQPHLRGMMFRYPRSLRSALLGYQWKVLTAPCYRGMT